MAKRRILTLILIVLAIIVVAVVFATVFSVRNVILYFYDEDGDPIAVPNDAFSADEVLSEIGSGNIFFMSKTQTMEKINLKFTQFHALAVTKVFPNTLGVHLVKRTAIFKLVYGNNVVYVDSFGYITSQTDADTINLTGIFSDAPISFVVGAKLEYNSSNYNNRLSMVLEAVNVVWQLRYAYSDVPKIIADVSFNDDNTALTITTQNGTKIVVYSPMSNLSQRLINGFSVYYNDMIDLQKDGITINISETGVISHID